MKKFLFSGLVVLLIAGQAFAQVERLPGVVDRPEDGVGIDIEKPRAPLEPAPVIERPADADTPVAKFNSVEFSGDKIIDEFILQRIAEPYTGRTINKGELAELKYKLTKAYYDRGYILVKVVTPPQNISNGVLKVEIYEAEVGRVRINDAGGVLNPLIAEGMSDRLSSGKTFNEDQAESIVSDLDDLKNVTASINLRPGQQFKTTDLDVYLGEADENEHYASIDNYGSELTGRNVGTLHLEHSNALHLGETLAVNLRKSNDDLFSAGFDAIVPTGFQNTKFELSLLRSENEIGDRLASLNAEGETNAATIGLSKNILNTRNEKITSRAGFEARNHESTLAGALDTKDKIRQIFVDSSYLKRTDVSVFYVSGKLSKGVDMINANEKGDANATRAVADPEALIFRPVVLANFRPEVLPFVPAINGEIKALLTGQLATDAVLSSDLFILGGYGSVRGFEVAQETGDSGYSFTVQYDHILNEGGDWNVKAGPFVDGGSVFNRVDGSTTDDHLYSAGIGVEAAASLIPAGETRLRVDLAHPLGAYSSNLVEDNMLYFSVKQGF